MSADVKKGKKSAQATERPSFLMRSLATIERLGNLLPHPFWLFVILAGVVVVLSAILSAMGVSVTDSTTGERIEVVSLLTPAGVQQMLGEALTNFITFPPLGMIIVVILGVGVAEGSGAISAAIRFIVSRVSAKWLTFTIALVGITGSVASDAIMLILIPLAAAAFKAMGRSAIMGAVVAYASASAGYNASLLVIPQDAVLAGITTAAAQIVDESYVVSPLANYFFSFGSSIVLAIIVTVVAELVLNKMTTRLRAEEDASGASALDSLAVGRDTDTAEPIDGANLLSYTAREARGLRHVLIALAVFLGVYFLFLFASWSPFAGETGPLSSLLLSEIVPVIAIMFIVLGMVYGITVGSITAPKDVPRMMAESVKELTPIIVLFLIASQFVAYFKWSNMGTVLALNGAEVLKALDAHPLVVLTGIVILISMFNLMITSGSAMWTLLAPIIVPMLMMVDISPETTQAVYRIADAPTNIMTPVAAYFVFTLGYIQKFSPKAGIGTLMSMTIPLAVSMLIGWLLLFIAWWLLGIPLGPGVPIR